MAQKITRRQALLGVSSTLLLPVAVTHVASYAQQQGTDVFLHGVASGDPDPTSVVIWTRISNASAPTEVDWAVASDEEFSNVVARGLTTTDAKRDYTVKIVADGLQPGHEYFYRFQSGESDSPIGRTRTLPTGHLDRLVLAVASCSNYTFGHFNAYEVIANDPTVDAVIHLGDYIYEHAADQYGGATGARIGRVHEPRHEILTLTDYRQRLAQYRTDAGSLAMHARHPLIAIWDDHESANNPWTGGAENHQPDEGSWKDRRAASLQAYYEWMPVRDPAAGGSRERYWRNYQFGDLANLITIESRHTGRSRQIDDSDYLAAGPTAVDALKYENEVINATERKMLSAEMNEFLETELAESIREQRSWRLIGNQTVMAKRRAPKLDESFFDTLRAQLDENGVRRLDDLRLAGNRNMLTDLDAWNGYPAARERFYQIAKEAGATDLLVLAGDSHSYWANALFDDEGQSMGVELGTTGISSPRSLLDLGLDGLKRFDQLNAAHNREVVWTDGRHRGFIRLELNHESARADFVTVSNVESREYDTRIVHSVDIKRENGGLRYV